MKTTLFAIATLLALVTHADYIYWMVDTANVSSEYNWDNAALYQDDAKIGTLSKSDAVALSALDSYTYATLNNPYTGSSFFIELLNGSTSVAKSESLAYEAVKANIFTGNPMSPVAAASSGFMPAGGTYNVPEPTSGLLFVIGGMLLGVKRKRQV